MFLRPSDRRVISGHHTLGHAAPPRIDCSEDRETASTSASGEDYDDLFDWELYDADCGQETDVTAPSEVSAEGNHLAASASVGYRPSDSDGDIFMADAEMSEPPHPFLWPAVDSDQPPREGSLSIEGQAGPFRPFLQPHSEYPVRGQPHTMHTQKRSRILESPEETNQVRDAGACYHCRMNKSKCSLGVCEWCKKQPFSELACIRKPMPNILGSIFSRWNFTETLRRDDLNENKHATLFISFSGKADSPCLKLTVAPFKGSARFGISSSATPSEPQILEWAKAQIVWESKHSPGFESRLDSFHLEHVRGKELERMLLPSLLRMKQMWKVWSCKAFFVHQRLGYAAERQLGSDYSSIQDCLRHIAGRSISQLERSIIKDVEDYLKKDRSVAPSSRLALDISKWLSLWQLISIYRQSLRLMLQQEHTDAAPLAMGVTDNYSERRRSFRTTTEDLLRGIVVIYYDLFHKRTTIQAIRDASPDVFGLSKTKLYDAFKQVLSANTEFYKQVLSQNITNDQFFIEYLIKRELKVLNPAKRR